MLIDTHKAHNRLTQERQFTSDQADALIDLWRMTEDRVATKQDLDALEQKIDARIARLERRMYAMGFLIVATLGALNFFT